MRGRERWSDYFNIPRKTGVEGHLKSENSLKFVMTSKLSRFKVKSCITVEVWGHFFNIGCRRRASQQVRLFMWLWFEGGLSALSWPCKSRKSCLARELVPWKCQFASRLRISHDNGTTVAEPTQCMAMVCSMSRSYDESATFTGLHGATCMKEPWASPTKFNTLLLARRSDQVRYGAHGHLWVRGRKKNAYLFLFSSKHPTAFCVFSACLFLFPRWKTKKTTLYI